MSSDIIIIRGINFDHRWGRKSNLSYRSQIFSRLVPEYASFGCSIDLVVSVAVFLRFCKNHQKLQLFPSQKKKNSEKKKIFFFIFSFCLKHQPTLPGIIFSIAIWKYGANLLYDLKKTLPLGRPPPHIYIYIYIYISLYTFWDIFLAPPPFSEKIENSIFARRAGALPPIS